MTKTTEPQKPFISPTHRLCIWAMKECGLPTAATTKQLEKLGAEFDAINATLTGLSADDANRAFKAAKKSTLTGKLKVEDFVDRETMVRRYAIRRGVIRQQLLAVSLTAKAIMADIFEQAAPRMPELAARVDASERALVSGQGPESKSVLVQSIEVLETHLHLRAKMMRGTSGISHPCHLLDA